MSGLIANLLAQKQQFSSMPQSPSGLPLGGMPFEGGMQSPYKQNPGQFNPMPFEGGIQQPSYKQPFGYNKKRMF